MNSIRPLITITILVVAFAFLYVKINESPMRSRAGTTDEWAKPPAGVPPLADTIEASAAATGSAPPWNAAATSASAAPVIEGDANAATGPASAPADALPAVAEVETPAAPPIPEMPEVAATIQPEPSAIAPIAAPAELPDNIPTARYPDQPAATDAATAPIAASAGTIAPTADVSATLPPAAEPATPESVTAASGITPETASMPLASQPNPLRQAAPPEPLVEPVVPAAPTGTQAISAISPVETSFVESWPTIQAALDRGELAGAHQMLSRWYDDPSLTPTDAERVESLLSQLAGTVVYSAEHQLAPAHVVKPGETLETIARQYNVSWQLLAKINGIQAADQVRAGQEIKVVPGPFSATVDLTRNQLTLTVDGRYAGKFALDPSTQAAAAEGEWVVSESLTFPGPGTAQRCLVLRQANPAQAAAQAGMYLGAVPAEQQSATTQRPVVGLTAADAEEVADILSIGSRVIIRR